MSDCYWKRADPASVAYNLQGIKTILCHQAATILYIASPAQRSEVNTMVSSVGNSLEQIY